MDESAVLLQAIKSMDAEALTKVFDLYSTAIYKYAFRHCGNAVTADQIVGDVFEKLLEKLSQGQGPSSNLRSYLYEMVYHAMVDEIRLSRRLTSINIIEPFLPAANSTDMTVERQNLMETILRAIRCDLTVDQRHVIILRYLENFSLKETALIMGKNVSNIKVIQKRAVDVLRRVLDDQAMEHALNVQDTTAQ